MTAEGSPNRLRPRTPGRRASDRPAEDYQALFEELQIRHLEIEKQNREFADVYEKLQESRNWYQDLYELAPLAYLTLDETGEILEINLRGAALLGLSPSDLEGRSISDFIVKEDLPAFAAHL